MHRERLLDRWSAAEIDIIEQEHQALHTSNAR